jgi:tetratricopeptide (TPR) repeat protein
MIAASHDSVAFLSAIRTDASSCAAEVLRLLGTGEAPVPEYSSLLLAESLLAGGLPRAALEAVGHSGDSLPPEPRGDAVVIRYVAMLRLGMLPEATALRASVPRQDSTLRSRLLHELGMFRHGNGLEGWRDALVESIVLWPSGYIHAPAWELLRGDMLEDPSLASSVADAFYSGGLWNELYDLACSSRAPDPRVVYLAARTRDRLGFYRDACRLLEMYLDRWPGGADAEYALMYLGLDLARGGDLEAGLERLSQWESRHPDSPRRGNLPWYAGSVLAEHGRWAEALPHFRRVVDLFPANVTADDAHFHVCLALLETGRAGEATDELRVFLSRRPESTYSEMAGYLLGRLLLDAGLPEGGDTLRSLMGEGRESLAARLAAQALGERFPLPSMTQEPLLEWMTRNGVQPPPPNPHVDLGTVLIDAGLRRWAVSEFRAAEETIGGGRLAPLYIELGVWERMPNAGWRLSTIAPEPWPVELWRLRYPAAWPEIVLPAAERWGFDPLMAWAVMRQESMFQPGCASPAGARGLIQMIPSTSEYVAAEQGWTGYSPDALFDPGVSVEYGLCYLSGIAGTVQGAAKLLASYNGGPHNASGRWGAQTLPDDLFFSRITFDETRRYVEKVIANYEIYGAVHPSLAPLAMPGNSVLTTASRVTGPWQSRTD